MKNNIYGRPGLPPLEIFPEVFKVLKRIIANAKQPISPTK